MGAGGTDETEVCWLGNSQELPAYFLSSALTHLQPRPPIFPSVSVLYLSLPVLHGEEPQGGINFFYSPAHCGLLGSLRVLLLMQHQMEERETKPGSEGSLTRKGSH